MYTRFSNIDQAPPIEVFAVSKAFNDDTNEKKINLSVGAYRTDDGKPWVLPVVRKVEQELAGNQNENHEYLPILGFGSLATSATKLVLGSDCSAVTEGRTTAVQTLSGTGGLRVSADFLAKVLKYNTFYFSNPTWGNHKLIFQQAGFQNGKPYRYWNEKTRGLDFEGMIEDLQGAPENSVIILHTCAHNPTGIDPTREQWKKIADVMQEKKLFPVFDTAYQGFASGSLENDAWSVRYFVERGFELLISQSFAKNFGLYNERIGNMVAVVKDASVIERMRSQLTMLVRGSYSNPPNHGAKVVARILNDPTLFEEWKECIVTMSSRVKDMRQHLYDRLKKLETPGTWEHITNQIGMFSYTGLTASQAKVLAEKYHIYLLSSGRINMCGINSHNIDYLANSIDEVVRAVSG